ncbi:uncharacterized protein BDCG_17935 [Blastomyces dermatitidis ER-3]|uniref:Uncharacterized protein n=1 Tax=Ajellomyces dermatitidis (strain ER-3 / ATCC MYA-2586) TaxID=559297 RepID=A0ABX2W162_AJEDR|nr:uncharacterized protein BDCG_17935 [Blastomyces dermatitidis ER-3]OAT03127.1 hypothetical protein BDCG_17935 [Blastomyces dermatitidis ER-3]
MKKETVVINTIVTDAAETAVINAVVAVADATVTDTESRLKEISHAYSNGHSSEAFESSIDETLSRFEAGLNTASDTVRPAPQSTQQLDAGSYDVYCSGEAISDQQMEHLKIILEMNKKKQRVLELELQLEKLHQQRFSTD